MFPTKDALVKFTGIGGISLIASFAASLYERTAFAAFFACAGGYAWRRPSTSRGAVANQERPHTALRHARRAFRLDLGAMMVGHAA